MQLGNESLASPPPRPQSCLLQIKRDSQESPFTYFYLIQKKFWKSWEIFRSALFSHKNSSGLVEAAFTANVTDVENKVQETTCLINGRDSLSPTLSLRHNPFLVYVYKIDKRIIHKYSQSVVFWHKSLEAYIFRCSTIFIKQRE